MSSSAGGTDNEFDVDDFRSEEQMRYDAMCDQAKQVTEQARQVTELVKTFIERMPSGHTQNITYRVEGVGWIGMFSAVICVICLLVLLFAAIIFVPDLHDIRAWQGTFGRDLAAMKAVQQQKEGQK